ncbi:hypothetical protein T265_14461, partial [Opisthorchis viverrini]
SLNTTYRWDWNSQLTGQYSQYSVNELRDGNATGQADLQEYYSVVGLFAELGSWIANVSSPIEVTSSLNPALKMSPRLVMKRLQSNCQARRTDQQPNNIPANRPVLSGALFGSWSVRRAWQLDCKRFITKRGDIFSAGLSDDVTSIGDETFAIQLPSSANRPTTKQRTRATYIPQH